MDEEKLIRACINGSPSAWDAFLKQYSRLIYNYIHHVLRLQGYYDSDVNIEEIFHDIILFLLEDNRKKLRSFKSINDCSFASWLRVVVINFTISYLRKIRDDLSLDQDDQQGLDLNGIIASDDMPVPEKLIDQERADQLEECIQALDMEDKYFLELHMYCGVSLDELKDYLDVSRGAIDMRKARLLDELKDCFRKKGFKLDF